MRPCGADVRVDGIDANDPVCGYSPAGVFLGLNEFTEISVLTQTFNVKYGRNGGGAIDTVTKSSRCCLAVVDSKAGDSQGVIGVRA